MCPNETLVQMLQEVHSILEKHWELIQMSDCYKDQSDLDVSEGHSQKAVKAILHS